MVPSIKLFLCAVVVDIGKQQFREKSFFELLLLLLLDAIIGVDGSQEGRQRQRL